MNQELIVLLIVSLILVKVGYSIFSSNKRTTGSKCGGCSGCDLKARRDKRKMPSGFK